MAGPMSSDEVTAATVPGAGRAGPADDWLGDETAIEWFPGDGETAGAGAAERRGRRRAGAQSGAGVAAIPPSALDPVYRRRRAAGIVAVLVLVAAVVTASLLLSGNGHPGPTTAPPVTTPAVGSSSTIGSTTGTTAKTHRSTPPSSTLRLVLPASGTLRQGDTGSAVKTLQQALAKLGSSPGKADGNFGPLTEQAVVAYQQANGLATDGIVGRKTAAKIDAALAAGG